MVACCAPACHTCTAVTLPAPLQVVQQDAKGRYVLDDSTTPPRIRAAQGHTIQLENPVLKPVAAADEVPLALHVTGRQAWEDIRASGELRSMARMHIHFATQPHMMRANSWANVLLQLDLAGAMAAGHRFFMSDNQVLLTEGPLPVAFVHQVQALELPEGWQAAMAGARQRSDGGGGGGGGRDSGRGGSRGGGRGRGNSGQGSAVPGADYQDQ